MRKRILSFVVGGFLLLGMTSIGFSADPEVNQVDAVPSAGSVSTTGAASYIVDNVHSRIGFSAQHLMVSKTMGEFTDYTGTITFDPADPSVFQAQATIKADSINTRNENRDNHLKSADFFDVAKFPTITFNSKKLDKQTNGYVLVGDLTIKDVTKEISIPVNIAGPMVSPFGGLVIGMNGETTINRQDFGITWNKSLDAGGVVVGDNIKIILEIEAGSK